MKARKTVEITTIREKANAFFANSKNELAGERKTLQMFVADLLMNTGNYRGFNYLEKHHVVLGQSFGVDHSSVPPVFYDESRIFFH
jgi:hypothetical protein